MNRDPGRGFAAIRVVIALLVASLGACGGGGGGGGSAPVTTQTQTQTPDPTPDPGDGGEPADQDGLAHCAGSGGGSFKNVSTDLGLCYNAFVGDGAGSDAEQIGGGLALLDIDKDGSLDLYVAHGHSTVGRLYSFDGTRFIERTDSGIDITRMDMAGYFIDLDGDGWKDFLSAQYDGIEIFINDQTGGFIDGDGATTITGSRATFSVAAADHDADGDLDLFFAHWGTGRIDQSEYLWVNGGGGNYTDESFRVPVETGVSPNNLESEYSFTPLFSDFDADGDMDLLLASDFELSQVLENEVGGDLFVDQTTDVISDENGMGAAVADYDRDGDLDWFVSSIWDPEIETNGSGNRLYRNLDGMGNFEDVTDEAGVREGHWGWGSCFADFDNDGYVDIFHTNGHQSQTKFENDPSRLFMSNGDGTFTERAAELGITHTGQGRGLVCADYDADGKVDIFIANNGNSPTVFRNDHDNTNHFVAIDLVGVGANPDAVGARVTVTTAAGSQVQEVYLGTAYLSQAPSTLHFGLGADDQIQTIDIAWPGPGNVVSRVTDVDADQRIEILHP